jgi:two-component system response regulator GlrR
MTNKEKPRILLVDDDTDLLSLLSIRLENGGYDITTAVNGKEALAVLPRIQPHVVITDLRMEKMDGIELFKAIHRQSSSLPVIVITAHGSIPEAVEATRRGVFSFLPKPIDSQNLIKEIEAALGHSGYLTAEKGGAEDSNKWCQEIIYQSSIMANLLQKAKLVAQSNSSAFIMGESGTGKELLAKAIHKASERSEHPFVAVNCAAIPETLLESELFGHIKGAFTGATSNYQGLFKSAHGGTLFLDEIGDMPLALQVKLLRVLQEQQVRPVGSTKTTKVDVRIISATHRDIEQVVDKNEFRQDLYYRLNVVNLKIPALNDRREDIPMLANHFLKKFTESDIKKINGFSPEAMKTLIDASWPGNIRQLCNVVEQAVALTTSAIISEHLILEAINHNPPQIPPLAEARQAFEQDYLVRLLQSTNGNVSEAAKVAKRNRTDFYKLLNRHHIAPSAYKGSSV